MIRTLGLVQAVRLAASGSPDLAAASFSYAGDGRRSGLAAYAIIWERLRYRRSSVALVVSVNGKLLGMVSARRGSGPTAWFVDHLMLPGGDDAPLCDLLEAASTYAGKQGAERLFLRVPDEWYLQKLAYQSGFTALSQVLVLTLPGRSLLYKEEPRLATRVRRAADDLALFRLYNACTPAEVRYKTGMTLQQWKDALEPSGQRTRELVVESEGEVVGWIRMDVQSGCVKVRTLTLSTEAVDMPSLVAYVVRASSKRDILWEASDYQADLHLLLERMGFEVSGCYRLMVNSLALVVKEQAWAPAPTSV